MQRDLFEEQAAKKAAGPVPKILAKYRVTDTSEVEDPDVAGRALGEGPLLSPDAVAKFVAADPTQGKRYLDWMLFQAAGGPTAISGSLMAWGKDRQPTDLKKFFAEYKNSSRGLDFIEYARAMGLSMRDFGHACYVFNAMRENNLSIEDADSAWETMEKEYFRQFSIGDQDAAKKGYFGFYRNWPGKDESYEQIVETVKSFIGNCKKLQDIARHNEMAKKENPEIERINATLPPDQQRPLHRIREIPKGIVFDIGIVKTDPDKIMVYFGNYPELRDLNKANIDMASVGLRQRVMADVQFSAKGGKTGPNEVLYEDNNLIVKAPLTVAASIIAGFDRWCVANLSAVEDKLRDPSGAISHWTSYTLGTSSHSSRQNPAAFVYFHFKKNVGNATNIAAQIFTSGLKTLKPNDSNVDWYDQRNNKGATDYEKTLADLKRDYPEAAVSFEKGMKEVCAWAHQFDPEQIVKDWMRRHMTIESTDLLVYKAGEVVANTLED